MPIEIKIVDGGAGSIIETRETVGGRELAAALHRHFTQDREQFKKYHYILFDFTASTKIAVTDETVDLISTLCADAFRVNPDPVVAIATYFSMTVNLEQIKRITKLYDLFLHGTGWESLLFRTKMEAVRWIRKKVRAKFGIDDLTFC